MSGTRSQTATRALSPEGHGTAVLHLDSARDINVRDLVPHGIRVDGMNTLRIRKHAIDDIVLLSLRGTASTELSIETHSKHPDDALFLFVTSRGFSRRPWQEVEPQSTLILAPSGANVKLTCGGRWDVIVALSPRASIETMVESLPTKPRTYPDRRVLDRSMQRFVEELLDADTAPTSIERYAIAQLLAEMSGAILLDRFGLAGQEHRDTPVTRAIALISQQCTDPDLTPAVVAHAVHTSLRLLQIGFAEEGKTIASEIRWQRARVARALLTDSRHSHLSVTEIMERAGFRTAMSMRRALDQEYGATPRTLRRQPSMNG
ncbi:helix-turn-helix domain-containing protein [Microbacterium murale]|uniref:AraC-like DNA-binding protein n=1 Tax=Microbacterium murale TaxID=1081040 RepID=A0ABU0PD57_9MICO|nr:helix-turn-helix domain-containing protein [Microbacterium murale]MDQ0644559.1 AraC-like DNA-binding protein [Microbacterium murale]